MSTHGAYPVQTSESSRNRTGYFEVAASSATCSKEVDRTWRAWVDRERVWSTVDPSKSVSRK